MAFTYDQSNDLGRVRFKLRDVRPEQPFFQDAEITYLLTDGGSVDGAVLAGARAMLMEIARYARSYSTSISDGGTSETTQEDETAAASFLQALIEQLEKQAPKLPTMTVRRLGAYPSDPTYTD